MTANVARTLTALQNLTGEFLVDFRSGIAHNGSASEIVNPKHVMRLVQLGKVVVRDMFHYSVATQSAQQLGVS